MVTVKTAAAAAAMNNKFEKIQKEQIIQKNVLQACWVTMDTHKKLLADISFDVASLGIKSATKFSALFQDLRTINQGLSIVHDRVIEVNGGVKEVNGGVKVIGFNVVKSETQQGSFPFLNRAAKVLNTLVTLLPVLDSFEKMMRNKIHGSRYYISITSILVAALAAVGCGTTMPNSVKGIQIVIYTVALTVGFFSLYTEEKTEKIKKCLM